jgi:integrase
MMIESPIELQAKKVGGKKSRSKGIMKTLILRTKEFKQIIKECDRKHQIIFSCLLFSGMRYEEMLRFRQHREWFDGQFIHLPAGLGEKKALRVDPERWIRLSYRGEEKP